MKQLNAALLYIVVWLVSFTVVMPLANHELWIRANCNSSYMFNCLDEGLSVVAASVLIGIIAGFVGVLLLFIYRQSESQEKAKRKIEEIEARR